MTRAQRGAVSVAIVIAIIGSALTACGRRGLPRPPEDVRPAAIVDLRVEGMTPSVLLTWSRPDRYTDGSQMRDLAGFEVRRADPAMQSGRFETIATIAVDDRDRFRQIERFTYNDGNSVVGATYRYHVISFTTDRYRSAPSNEVEIHLLRSE